MQKFIGVGFVDAKPMTRGEYNEYRGWTLPADEDPMDAGCLVRYASGYESWCPTAKFIKQYTPFTNPNSVSQEDVDNFIGSYAVNNIQVGGVTKTTMVTAILVNGFVIHETSTCVDPENYDERVGAEICVNKIKEKVWDYLGFLLQCGTIGFKAILPKGDK